MLKGQAICKDCGNGTMDNLLNSQFELFSNEHGDEAACVKCGSNHIDGELYMEYEGVGE